MELEITGTNHTPIGNVRAKNVNGLAVHKTIGLLRQEGYTVTHPKSGAAMIQNISKEDAISFAKTVSKMGLPLDELTYDNAKDDKRWEQIRLLVKEYNSLEQQE